MSMVQCQRAMLEDLVASSLPTRMCTQLMKRQRHMDDRLSEEPIFLLPCMHAASPLPMYMQSMERHRHQADRLSESPGERPGSPGLGSASDILYI